MTAPRLHSDSTSEAKGLAILFADDERSLQELMKLEIPRMGHRVTVCPDGLTAAAALEKDSFDCLLVDLDMPGLNGIDVIAKAKELTAETEALLRAGGQVRRPPRAFALAAVRETREEAGLVLGDERGPDLSKLQFVARAITPASTPWISASAATTRAT